MAGRRGREVYATREWAHLRLAKLRAANWRCERCGAYAREVHHVVPLHAGGPALPPLDGLQVLCGLCHYGEHRTARRKAWRSLLNRVRTETCSSPTNSRSS